MNCFENNIYIRCIMFLTKAYFIQFSFVSVQVELESTPLLLQTDGLRHGRVELSLDLLQPERHLALNVFHLVGLVPCLQAVHLHHTEFIYFIESCNKQTM